MRRLAKTAGILAFCTLAAARHAAAQDAFIVQPIPKSVQELRAGFTTAQIDILEKLNRRDREHLIRVDPPVPGIIVPSAWTAAGTARTPVEAARRGAPLDTARGRGGITDVDAAGTERERVEAARRGAGGPADEIDELRYSPLPQEWPAVASHPKYLIVHQPWQVFGAYELGKLVRWGPISSGRKETPTPSGAFNLTWRSRKRTSTDNDAWVLEWYFNFINSRGVSFHQFDLPGYAASHACVRLLQRDAQWIYGWGVQWVLSVDKRTVEVAGTPVLVLGAFAHGETPPWTSTRLLATPIELPASVGSAAPVTFR